LVAVSEISIKTTHNKEPSGVEFAFRREAGLRRLCSFKKHPLCFSDEKPFRNIAIYLNPDNSAYDDRTACSSPGKIAYSACGFCSRGVALSHTARD